MNTSTQTTPARNRRRILPRFFLAVLMMLCAPLVVCADDAKDEGIDGRMEGFSQRVALAEPANTTLTWVFFGVLATMTLGVTFMGAKRTHLD